MAARDYPVGRVTRCYVKVQPTDIDTAADGEETAELHIAAADGFKVDESGLTITPIHNSFNRNDSQESRDIVSTTPMERGPHEWTVSTFALPSGTGGTAPDIDPILQSFMEKSTSAAFTIATVVDDKTFTGTTGVISEGDIIGVPSSVGSTTIEAAFVASVSTESNVDTIVLAYDLSFTPIPDTVIAASVQYAPMTNVDATKFFQLKKTDGGSDEMLSGCIANEFSITANRGEPARISISGMAQHHFGFSQTTLKTDIDNSVTSMTLENGYMGWGIDATHPVFVRIDDEIVKITALVADTGVATIVRSQKTTSAAPHDDLAAVTFWDTLPTTTGVPISGVQNTCNMGGIFFGMDEVTFTTNEGVISHENAGSDEVETFIMDKLREISIESTLTGHKNDWQVIAVAVGRNTTSQMYQMGTIQGQSMAVYCPTTLLAPPEIPSGLEGKITVPITTIACMDSNDDDEGYRIAFI